MHNPCLVVMIIMWPWSVQHQGAGVAGITIPGRCNAQLPHFRPLEALPGNKLTCRILLAYVWTHHALLEHMKLNLSTMRNYSNNSVCAPVAVNFCLLLPHYTFQTSLHFKSHTIHNRFFFAIKLLLLVFFRNVITDPNTKTLFLKFNNKSLVFIKLKAVFPQPRKTRIL